MQAAVNGASCLHGDVSLGKAGSDTAIPNKTRYKQLEREVVLCVTSYLAEK